MVVLHRERRMSQQQTRKQPTILPMQVARAKRAKRMIPQPLKTEEDVITMIWVRSDQSLPLSPLPSVIAVQDAC